MTDCIFCKIIKGEIPCTKIYEDNYTFAMLDIRPATEKGGHVLVMPKQHFETIDEISEEILAKTMCTIKKISRALLKKYQGLNILQNNRKVAGQFVPHIHFHLIPRYPGDDVKVEVWKPHEYANGQAEKIAKEIKTLLK